MSPSGSPYGIERRVGAGDASDLGEELAPVTTDDNINTGVGALRREPVGRDGDGWSTVVSSVISPVAESIRKPMVVVSTRGEPKGARRDLLIMERRRSLRGDMKPKV